MLNYVVLNNSIRKNRNKSFFIEKNVNFEKHSCQNAIAKVNSRTQ